jgi:proteic killer suppression protein
VIVSFYNKATEDIFNGLKSREARNLCPQTLWRIAFRKLDQIDVSISLSDLQVPPGNRLEALKGNRMGQYSIRINNQYRVCFRWTDSGAEDVEIVDYH